MSIQQPSLTGSQWRTRKAILEAAIREIGRNPSVALGDIATAAQVGRTTLHRYFPDRASVLEAVRAEVVQRMQEAFKSARPSDGTGAEALRRLCREYFELGDLLNLLFTEAVDIPDEAWSCEGEDESIYSLVCRGIADGSINARLTPEWLQSLMWSILYAGWSHVREGAATKHETLDLVLHSLKGAVFPEK